MQHIDTGELLQRQDGTVDLLLCLDGLLGEDVTLIVQVLLDVEDALFEID